MTMQPHDSEQISAEAVAMLARVIEVGSDSDALFGRILDLVVESTQADSGFVIFTGEDGEMRFRSGHNITEAQAGPGNPELSYGAVRRVLKSGLPYVAGPAQTGRGTSLSVRALSIRWLLCFPIPHEGRTVGVVYLDQRGDGPGFTDSHLKLMQQFAARIGHLVTDSASARASVSATRTKDNSLQKSLTKLREKHMFEGLVGPSAAMQQVFTQLRAAAANAEPLLIIGESGTGRRASAAAVHRHGRRGGEIAVGGQAPSQGTWVVTGPIHAPPGVRLIVTTDDPGLDMDALRITLPPLRDRVDDLPHLAEHFLGAGAPALGDGVLDSLLSYRWPGNVRELEQEMARLKAGGRAAIGVDDLPLWIREQRSFTTSGLLGDRMKAFERMQIVEALQSRGQDVAAAASALGISAAELRARIKALGIE